MKSPTIFFKMRFLESPIFETLKTEGNHFYGWEIIIDEAEKGILGLFVQIFRNHYIRQYMLVSSHFTNGFLFILVLVNFYS